MDAPDGYVYVKVETGVSDDSYTEIKSGLQEDDTVAYIDTSSCVGMDMMMGGMPGGDMLQRRRYAWWRRSRWWRRRCPQRLLRRSEYWRPSSNFRTCASIIRWAIRLVKAADHITMKHREGGVRGHRGPVRLGQVHLHEHHRLPGRAHRTASTGSTAGMWARWTGTSWPMCATRCWASSSSSITCCPG